MVFDAQPGGDCCVDAAARIGGIGPSAGSLVWVAVLRGLTNVVRGASLAACWFAGPELVEAGFPDDLFC